MATILMVNIKVPGGNHPTLPQEHSPSGFLQTIVLKTSKNFLENIRGGPQFSRNITYQKSVPSFQMLF